MTKLKSIGETSLIIAILLISLFLTYLLIVGGVIVGAKIITVFAIIYDIIFLIDLIVLIPLAFFKKTRSVSAIGLFVSSYVLGAFTWISAFLATYSFWGVLGIFIGIALAGVGIVFTGFLAALLHGYWYVAVNLALEVVVLYGARFLGLHFAEKADEDSREKTEKISEN